MLRIIHRTIATAAFGLFGLALTLPFGASAAPFTLSAPIDITNASLGVVGTINPTFNLSGAFLPAPNQDGTINPGFANQDVFVVDITLGAGSASLDAIGFTVGSPLFFLNPAGAGAFDDLGDQDSTSATADSVVLLGALFDFSGDLLEAGETSVRLFSTHGGGGDMAAGQTVMFMISSGTDYSMPGLLTPIPEPGTFLLLGSALVALGIRTRQGR